MTALRSRQRRTIDRMTAAARSGTGGAIVLLGEEGIGKTRLASAAAEHAAALGMWVLHGRASAVGRAVPLRPLRDAMACYARAAADRHRLALGPYATVLGRLIPEWAAQPDTSDADSLILAEALLRLLRTIGDRRGCLLVLDDLQHADAESMAVLDYLMDNIADQPVAVLAAMRPDPGTPRDVFQAAVQRHACDQIELQRLDQAELRAFAHAWLAKQGRPAAPPDELVEQLWAISLGHPVIAEQLLHDLIGDGALRQAEGGWRLDDHGAVPASLSRPIAARVAAIGAGQVLTAAAVLGRRFPLAVLHAMLPDSSVYAVLRDADGLVHADEEPGWYAFSHAFARRALIAGLSPDHRAAMAARAADAITELHPDLPGEWCHLAAALRLDAGDQAAAAALFATAGRRAIAAGNAQSAVALLDHAHELLPGRQRATVLSDLVTALAEAGDVERALGYMSALDDSGTEFDSQGRAALHTRLAWAASLAGRVDDGFTQIDAARTMLGDAATPAQTTHLDLIAAHLTLELPGRTPALRAERMARRCLADAEHFELPELACQAGLLVGCLIRQRNLTGSTAAFTRVNALAHRHDLPIWQLRALIRLGGNESLHDGSLERLHQARQLAHRLGAVTAVYETEANLAMQTVLRGDFATATTMIDAVYTPSARLRLTETTQYMLVTRAVHAAHQGHRADMDQALRQLRRWQGDQSHHMPLAWGMARAFCALLEEDRARAAAEIERAIAWEDERFTIFQLTGRYGLLPLLEVLSGDTARYDTVRRSTSTRRRWNRQFLKLADAVVLGRNGHGARAAAAVRQAAAIAQPYRMAYHLGRRLVAEAALADGWGEPQKWLSEAEAYFAERDMVPPASACRALLRQAGVPVGQRRRGVWRIPAHLRSAGVTVREFEVLRLLVSLPTNSVIAGQLHLSPRTVEKHVASLMAKTSCRNRTALSAIAADLVTE